MRDVVASALIESDKKQKELFARFKDQYDQIEKLKRVQTEDKFMISSVSERMYMFEEMREAFNKNRIEMNDAMYKIKGERQQQDVKIHSLHKDVDACQQAVADAEARFT